MVVHVGDTACAGVAVVGVGWLQRGAHVALPLNDAIHGCVSSHRQREITVCSLLGVQEPVVQILSLLVINVNEFSLCCRLRRADRRFFNTVFQI